MNILITVNPKKSQALYVQVVEEFKKIIIKGIMKSEEKIPSVRELANSLKINPNTIQKAYRELEREGYIYIVQGRGAFVNSVEKKNISEDDKKQIEEELKKIILDSVYKGFKLNEINNLFQDILSDIGGAGKIV